MGTVDFDAWCTPRALAQFAKEERARGNDVPQSGGVGLLARMRRAGPQTLREPDLPKAPPSQLEQNAQAQRGTSPRALMQILDAFARDPQYSAIVRTIASFDTPRTVACFGWVEPRGYLPDDHHIAISGSGWCVMHPAERGGWALRPLTVDDLRGVTLQDVMNLKAKACWIVEAEDLPKLVRAAVRPEPPSLKQRLTALLWRSTR